MKKKPWDKLRKPQTKPPIGSGTFDIGSSTTVEVKQGVCVHLRLWHHCTDTPAFLNRYDLRQLAEFCTELAEQLEAGDA